MIIILTNKILYVQLPTVNIPEVNVSLFQPEILQCLCKSLLSSIELVENSSMSAHVQDFNSRWPSRSAEKKKFGCKEDNPGLLGLLFMLLYFHTGTIIRNLTFQFS